MELEARVRVSKKRTLYVPNKIARAVGLREGSLVKLRVYGNKIVLEPIPDPFDLALKAPKYAKTSFKEFEEQSKAMQDELFK